MTDADSPARSRVERVLREVVAPLLRGDGAELHLVECDPGRVHVHLTGRYAGGPGNTLVERHVIEPLIGAAIEATEGSWQVVVTSGAVLPAGARRIRPE